MLTLQGQGASPSIEDAEALEALFSDVGGCPTQEVSNANLKKFSNVDMRGPVLSKKFSRQQAKRASNVEGTRITMDATEFMEYNCRYEGAKDWQEKQKAGKIDAKSELDLTERSFGGMTLSLSS
jgi:salicylate hydroxylase